MADQYVSEIVKEVSEYTNLRQDIVSEVLSGLVDVSTEKIINEKSFNLLGIVTISSKQWKSSKIGDIEKEAHERLTVKISWRIRELKKMSQNTTDKLTRSNWKNWHRTILNKKKKSVTSSDLPEQQKPVTEDNDVILGFDIFDDE